MEKIHLFFDETNLLLILAIGWALRYGSKYLQNSVENAFSNNEETKALQLKFYGLFVYNFIYYWWVINTVISLYKR